LGRRGRTIEAVSTDESERRPTGGPENRQRRAELQALLEERRREAEARYRQALTEQQSGSAAGDSEGVHGWKASREGGADLAVLESLDRTVQQIDAALARLRAGRYGSCASCGEAIPTPRLRAVPFATLCVPCQSRSESAGGAGRRAGS
jgi:RNA polymerase-binding transcription factor